MRKVLFLLYVVVFSVSVFAQDTTEGSLYAVGKKGNELGACPLKHTSVKTDISGFLARVRVTQEFENSFGEPIEAVYTFPLSQNGAVDEMTMKIGERVISGKIMKREEARKVYETAKTEGKTASLLDQERPNIFTQAVANIMPGDKVVIKISYVETLKYEDGAYEFVFPMTVAPRYIPASSDKEDAGKISAPVSDTRAGHDISVEVNINAGVPIEAIRSDSHQIQTVNLAANSAKVSLTSETTIPNKDFVLRYDVTGKRMEDAILVHKGEKGGFFSLILTPPERLSTEDIAPKEIVFVLDTSGSMEGFPIEKAKESMKAALDGLYPNDTFNLITFAGDTHILFDQPVPATKANLDKAQEFLASREGDGGTEMMDAVRAALEPSDAQDHVRIVCFMTDGEVGNDMDIIAEVKKHPKARVFSFGIGDSVNRFLLDSIAKEGRGEAEYVLLEQDGSPAAKRFHERIRNPYLTDISIDWNGLAVTGVYPKRLPDLFGAKPIVIFGKYTTAGSGTIKLRGKIGGQPFEREIKVSLPAGESDNDVLSSLWARTKIDELMSQSWDVDSEKAKPKPVIRDQITKLGIDYGLLTQYTSFVAVEERIVNQMRNGKRVRVPVYAPAGTVFKDDEDSPGVGSGNGSGIGMGNGSGGGGNASVSSQTANMTVVTRSGVMGPPPPSPNPGGVSATVDVTSESVSVDATETKVQTSVTTRQISSLPRGTGFTSLLRITPKARARPLAGQYSVNGAIGPENPFVIDGAEVSNYRTGILGAGLAERGKTLAGQAVLLPRPVTPRGLSPRNAVGAVNVEISIDEGGNITSATATSGNVKLRGAAEKAAIASKFAPTVVGEKPVKVEGLMRYSFSARGVVRVFVDRMRVAAPPPDMRRVFTPEEKLHVWLFDLVERLKKVTPEPTPNEVKFVRDGKASIRIELSDKSAETLEKLKALGFEAVLEKGRKTLIGRIPIEKLSALADIDAVRLVLPSL